MKDLSQFWCSLEGIQGLHAIPAFWARYCDPHFDLIRPYLRATDMVGGDYPCPHPKRGGACARRIVDLGDGEFEGICIDPYKLCPDLPLTSKDVVVHRLDIACFTRMLADVLDIRWQAPERRAGYAWGIGLSRRQKSLNQPVFFVVESSQENFRKAVLELLASVPGPFVLVAPTDQHREISLQEHFERRSIGFISLAERVQLDEEGRLVSIEPMESAEGLPPVEDRQGSAVAGQAADRSVGSQAAVNAVHDYLAAKVLTLTKFGIQFETTDRTIRRFLRTGKMRRANFEAMATAIGITADQLLRGELPPSIQRRTP